MSVLHRATFTLLPRLRLRFEADRPGVLAHFGAEYGNARTTDDETPPDLDVAFRPVPEPTLRGGHKTVNWRVELGAPEATTLSAAIELRGVPRAFGLSLVQGYFVEPLLSLAATRAGSVLLPCAAISTEEGLLLLLGKSRSGKSSLAVRALAAGAVVLGDDQAFLDAEGRCTTFPRRMRFYSDLRLTAPHAYERLTPWVRGGLVVRGGVRRLTRGFVAPPVRVGVDAIGRAAGAAPLPVSRVVLIERQPDLTTIQRREVATGETVDFALTLLDEQRAKLADAGLGWADVLRRARADEGATLRAAFQRHSVERIGVPLGWSATQALPVLAYLLGIPS